MTLEEAAARARHDLGKYVAFQTRWTGVDAPPEALREALRADLLRTRSGPAGTADAATVWAELRGPLLPAGVDAIDALVARLAAYGARLDTLDPAGLREAATLALRLGDELKALHMRLRE